MLLLATSPNIADTSDRFQKVGRRRLAGCKKNAAPTGLLVAVTLALVI